MLALGTQSVQQYLSENTEVDQIHTYYQDQFLFQSRHGLKPDSSVGTLNQLTSSQGYWVHSAHASDLSVNQIENQIQISFTVNSPDGAASLNLAYSEDGTHFQPLTLQNGPTTNLQHGSTVNLVWDAANDLSETKEAIRLRLTLNDTDKSSTTYSNSFSYSYTSSGDAVGGQQIYHNNCRFCHSTSTERIVGPGFSGITNRLTTDVIQSTIATGPGIMPAFTFSEQELQDLLAYLGSL